MPNPLEVARARSSSLGLASTTISREITIRALLVIQQLPNGRPDRIPSTFGLARLDFSKDLAACAIAVVEVNTRQIRSERGCAVEVSICIQKWF